MKDQALVTVISPCAFLLGMMITVYAVTSSSGGSAKLEVLGNGFEIKNNDVDFEKLFSDDKYKETAKEAALKIFGLYELNENESNEALISKIESLSHDGKFAKRLLEMRDQFKGPFNSPDQEVTLVFNDSIPKDKAEVCPDSDFYKKRLNIALSDFSKMAPIDNASVMALHGCPIQNGTKERIVVNTEVGKLLGIDHSTTPIDAVARVLPSFIIINK